MATYVPFCINRGLSALVIRSRRRYSARPASPLEATVPWVGMIAVLDRWDLPGVDLGNRDDV